MNINKDDKNVGEVVSIKEGTTYIKSNDDRIYKIEKTGIDDNGKDVYIASEKPEWITPTKLRYPNGRIVSIDPNEEPFEVYNPNLKPVFFVCDHYNPVERAVMPKIIKIPHDSFGFIPSKYYIPYIGYVGNIELFDVIVNYGETMFTGNKKASAPDKRIKLF